MDRKPTPRHHRSSWLLISVFTLQLIGCSGDGGLSYDAFYEGLLGDAPPLSESEAVFKSTNREDADDRRRGVSWLGSAGYGANEEHLILYRQLIEDDDGGVRAAAAKALGRNGTAEDALLLMGLLDDDDALVRWQAADALRKIHNPAAVPELLDRLNRDIEDDQDVRSAAALALGQYPQLTVFTRLVEALNQGSYQVASAARHSLTQLTGHDAGLDPRDWADWGARNPDPFSKCESYTYKAYQLTPGWFSKYILFWSNEDPYRTPVGLDDPSTDG